MTFWRTWTWIFLWCGITAFTWVNEWSTSSSPRLTSATVHHSMPSNLNLTDIYITYYYWCVWNPHSNIWSSSWGERSQVITSVRPTWHERSISRVESYWPIREHSDDDSHPLYTAERWVFWARGFLIFMTLIKRDIRDVSTSRFTPQTQVTTQRRRRYVTLVLNTGCLWPPFKGFMRQYRILYNTDLLYSDCLITVYHPYKCNTTSWPADVTVFQHHTLHVSFTGKTSERSFVLGDV